MTISVRRWLSSTGIAIGSVGLTVLLSFSSFLQAIQLKTLDLHFLLRGAKPASGITLLVIDEKSLNTFPELMLFWHPYYAEAIRAAAGAGAKVFGLDVAFGIPVTKWEPDHDSMLADAVASTAAQMPVICGYVPSLGAKQKEWPVPINMIASALQLSAYSNLTVDADDFVRRQELFEQPSGAEPPARSFAMRLAEKLAGADAVFSPAGVTLNGVPIPVTPNRTIQINYRGPAGTFPRVPLSDFVAAARAGDQQKLKQWVEGKAVLLGPDHIEDRHATPFYRLFGSSRWNTPGVEIHANTLHTLMAKDYLLPVPQWLLIVALFVNAWIAASAVVMESSVTRCVFLAMVTQFLAAGASHLLFLKGASLSSALLFVAALIAILGALVFRFATAEKRGDLFHKAISLFVGRSLASTLEQSRSIALSGDRQTMTIMFTDVRGFTTFCDAQDPTKVVELLNGYLSTMVDIIIRHKGEVNKFLGDGILAVFSDQDGSLPGDHATRAVLCAAEMVTQPGPFDTGAGIHTGPVVIGNIGSAAKMEYTVMGDTVNLASRLESLNKEFKTRMLFSSATLDALVKPMEATHLGDVPVRGKAVPIRIYTLPGMVKESAA